MVLISSVLFMQITQTNMVNVQYIVIANQPDNLESSAKNDYKIHQGRFRGGMILNVTCSQDISFHGPSSINNAWKHTLKQFVESLAIHCATLTGIYT